MSQILSHDRNKKVTEYCGFCKNMVNVYVAFYVRIHLYIIVIHFLPPFVFH